MLKQLILVHSSGAGELDAPHWLEVKTCLRSFWVGFRGWDLPHLPAGKEWQVLEGKDAYQKLVEISCGLHSPVLGETEVFGQIRKACSAYMHPDPEWQQIFQKVVQKLYADVKLVRRRHLTSLGAKSYGSYSRKFFKDSRTVRIFGAGQLALEILPWLAKSTEQVFIHSRRSHLEITQSLPSNVILQGYDQMEGPREGGLLVAAPLSGDELKELLGKHSLRVDRILDLREESAQDPICLPSVRQETLADVFRSFEKNKADSQVVKERALKEVSECLKARMAEPSFRPKGWDAICAV